MRTRHIPAPRHALAAAALLVATALPAAALDTFSTGVNINDGGDTTSADLYVTDVSVLDGNVCIGNGCTDGEVFDSETLLKLRSANPSIEFHDTSGTSFPREDWKIVINSGLSTANGGVDRFAIEDTTAGTLPFVIEGGANANTLYIDNGGRIGSGTTNPSVQLHLVSGNTPTIRLEQDGSSGFQSQSWDLAGNETTFFLRDNTHNSTQPFRVYPGSSTNTLVLAGGFAAIGTTSPKAGLHVKRESETQTALLIEDATAGTFGGIDPRAFVHVRSTDGIAKVLVEETSLTSNPRTMLELVNTGRPEIVMANTATGGEWSFGAGTDFFLKVGTVGSVSGAKTKVFTVKDNGDAILLGSLTTGGTTCGGGCDRVFSDDYVPPSIAEHARNMYALGYLPNVGPTIEGEPVNLTDKVGRMLNELEHAHIYIAQQQSELVDQAGTIADQARRIERLEAALFDLGKTRN